MKSQNKYPHFGYVFHYPRLDQPGDHFSMEVFLFNQPTGTYFDVICMRVGIKTKLGDMERVKITHPWALKGTCQVCNGTIEMESRDGKKEQVFTFGGKLDINSQPNLTQVTLYSPAPILNITNADPLHTFFIDELEIVLAQHRARNPDEQEFESLLYDIEPLDLYLGCLFELIEKFEHFPNKCESYLQLLMYLHAQDHRLKSAGLVKSPQPNLRKLLMEN